MENHGNCFILKNFKQEVKRTDVKWKLNHGKVMNE